MATVLKISDGTTTVNFITDSAYNLVDWSPGVATRRPNLLGGRGPYTDVIEEMRLTISGASALTKLGTLVKLMDQAEQWARGEPVDPVTLTCEMASASDEYTAVIFGAPSPGEPAIELPGRYADTAALGIIDPVILRFRRAGLWLAADDTGTGPTAAVNPTTLSSTLTGTAYADSPYTIGLTGIPWNEEATWESFILAVSADTAANAAKKLVILDAEDFETGASGPTAVADTTNKARGDYVLQYDMTAGVPELSLLLDISASVHPDVRRWAVFVSVRNNSATVSFKVRARLSEGTVYSNSYTPWATIPADYNDNEPAWVYLGNAAIRNELQKMLLEVESDGTGTIDFDSIALLAVDDPVTSSAVAIRRTQDATTGKTFSGTKVLYLEHALDFDIRPSVYYIDGSDLLFQSYNGNPALFAGADDLGIAVAWLACGQYNTAYWRATDSAGTLTTNSFAPARKKGQLTLY